MHRRLILSAPLLLPALAAPGFPGIPAAMAQEVRAGDLVITQPWSRAAGQGATGAGYLSITNRGTTPDRLLSVSSPAARAAELHTHMREGEVMRMRPVQGIDIPPGQTVTLQPGGLHVMLVGLKQPLRQGETVPVTLRFERAGEVQVNLAVQSAGARGPAHAH